MFKLNISSDYSNNYWFEYKSDSISGSSFLQCKKIMGEHCFQFYLKSKVSESRLFSYDFYFSDGPFFISPRLVSILSKEKDVMKDIQLVDCLVRVNDIEYHDYKIVNILKEISCIDVERSESRPLLSYLPNGPRKFEKIVFKEGIKESFSIARCQEYKSCVVISEQLRSIFLEINVKGIEI
ncbi:hypothetical protein NNQ28_00850 [Cronobacter dublinensis]|uniref:hypothetical protein n=1 Tax=Cronobacter dublinensis TaxID=413497 RepID=UPI00292F421A|nr:hypothetical protein [Cronobacter dublinensis]WNY83008.1 hypothetical protein NNQ28_00850 [Cronobacter dublinensis]